MHSDARYARQVILKGFGPESQQRLGAARVLIVGAGGLGSPASMYLAAAGVGTLTLVDRDAVDITNLHRQLLYVTSDVGRSKVVVAAERLRAINPSVTVHIHDTRLTAQNAAELIAGHDVVIDATDNFPARYAINDACVRAGVPFVYGSVARFEGQISVFAAADGPCYRCLFPAAPLPGSVPTCAEEGVLGVVPGVLGLYQATEALKWIAGIGTPLVGRMLLLDLLEHESRTIRVTRRAECTTCGVVATVSRAQSPAEPDEHHAMTDAHADIDVVALAARLTGGDALVVLDVREPWEFDLASVPNSTLVPLSTLPSAINRLERDMEYVVLCHHGMRSEMAANYMRAQGFPTVHNLVGGIDAWSLQVDPTVPRY
ncbi:MAG: HesA/MoeB/ThiF family protein [Gemmatimonadaceae bacterium]|nr:HesA/MoeB/ThiF family protein [Gemmatimonadaceae bacterium]